MQRLENCSVLKYKEKESIKAEWKVWKKTTY